MPSTVTCRSSIASRRLDWVRGVARLISSASRILVKTGPCLNSKDSSFWLKMETPVISVGRRSGVNWIRLNWPSIDFAIALARTVFPTPGTSLSRRCPLESRVSRAFWMQRGFPTITWLIFFSRSWIFSWIFSFIVLVILLLRLGVGILSFSGFGVGAFDEDDEE